MKKFFLAFAAVATIVLVGCKKTTQNEPEPTKPDEPTTPVTPTDIKEVIARYNDTIVMSTLMPGYTDYTFTIDNEANGFVVKDTLFVACIGETMLHITADGTVKKDVKLTVVPRLPEEYMFTMPSFDWSRDREALVKELGEPNSRLGESDGLPGDSCFAYRPKDDAEPFIYYYFNGEDFNNLYEIRVQIYNTNTEHGEVLKLFVAERFPYFGKGKVNNVTIWEYLNAPKRSQANTQILYYIDNHYWLSIRPYTYSK